MKVLLTRNELQNASMQLSLEKLGIETVNVALIGQESISSSQEFSSLLSAIEQISQKKQFVDDVIFISPSSAEFGAEEFLNYLATVSDKSCRTFAVGKGTAMLLKAQFPVFGDILFPTEGAGSQALLNMPEMQNLDQRNMLIITGAEGKPFLEEQLLKRKAQVFRWECYKRVKPTGLSVQLMQVLELGIDSVFFHSAHAARHFVESIASVDNTQMLQAVVGSHAIQDELHRLGWRGQILQADSPMPKDMLDCFIQSFS